MYILVMHLTSLSALLSGRTFLCHLSAFSLSSIVSSRQADLGKQSLTTLVLRVTLVFAVFGVSLSQCSLNIWWSGVMCSLLV